MSGTGKNKGKCKCKKSQAYLGYIHTGGIPKSPFLIDSVLSTPILICMIPNLFPDQSKI